MRLNVVVLWMVVIWGIVFMVSEFTIVLPVGGGLDFVQFDASVNGLELLLVCHTFHDSILNAWTISGHLHQSDTIWVPKSAIGVVFLASSNITICGFGDLNKLFDNSTS